MKYNYSSIQSSLHSQEPWINVIIFKYITIPLVYFIVNYTKITPNIISIISLILGMSSAYFYFTNEVFFGGLFYLISYIFDAIDGKVARIKGSGKPYGEWLDMAIDRLNLLFISTAIAYNYFVAFEDVSLLFLNSFFLGLFFIGSESRYFINLYKLKNSITENSLTSKSKYQKWCRKKGLINDPISLVELLLFYLIIAPQLQIEFYSCIIIILFLILRILKQQLFWKNDIKLK